MNLSLNFDTLTIDEVDLLEEISGQSIDTIARSFSGGGGKPMAKLLKAIAFVSARRENPDVTLEEVGALPVAAVLGTEEAQPIPPADASV